MTGRCSMLLLVFLLGLPIYAQKRSVSSIAVQKSSSDPTQTAAAVSPVVSCSLEKPVVWTQEKILLRVWPVQTSRTTQYRWSATGGRIEAQSTEARWDFAGVEPGYYTATVRSIDVAGSGDTCSVQVVVEERPGSRGTYRESGHDLLVKNVSESEGYGLYSYVLLATPPDDSSRERYLKAMEAFLQLIPIVADLEKYFERRQLNITYVPVTTSPESPPSAEWILDHYDYARARFLMRSLPKAGRQGVYIVSSLKPLSGTAVRCDPCLSQNLSLVPPHLVFRWMNEFLNQAAQEHFWDVSNAKELMLRLRTTIAILAIALPDVRKGLNEWIAWNH